MVTLTSGGNAPLGQDGRITATLNAGGAPDVIDVSCFMVRENGRVASDDFMVFYNQPKSPEGAVEQIARDKLSARFMIDLGRVPAEVTKCCITATIDGGHPVSAANGLVMTVDGGVETVVYPVTSSGSEKGLIVCEIYRHSSGWKVRAVGQGFNGGLAPLARHFGVVVEDDAPAQPVAPPPPPPPAAPVSLAKISLTKKGQSGTVNLAKNKGVTAKLRWTTRGDLDLYCLWVDRDGRQGMTYYRNLGSRDRAPFVQLMGDSKTPGEETVVIHDGSALRYALICAYSAVSNGTGSFKSFGAHAVVDNGAGQEIEATLDERSDFSYWAAIALIDFTVPGQASVRQVEQYGKKFSEKAPVLNKDGSVKMSAGVVEFK